MELPLEEIQRILHSSNPFACSSCTLLTLGKGSVVLLSISTIKISKR